MAGVLRRGGETVDAWREVRRGERGWRWRDSERRYGEVAKIGKLGGTIGSSWGEAGAGRGLARWMWKLGRWNSREHAPVPSQRVPLPAEKRWTGLVFCTLQPPSARLCLFPAAAAEHASCRLALCLIPSAPLQPTRNRLHRPGLSGCPRRSALHRRRTPPAHVPSPESAARPKGRTPGQTSSR